MESGSILPRPRRRPRTLSQRSGLVGLAVSALLLTACGGASSGASSAPPPAAPTTAGAPAGGPATRPTPTFPAGSAAGSARSAPAGSAATQSSAHPPTTTPPVALPTSDPLDVQHLADPMDAALAGGPNTPDSPTRFQRETDLPSMASALRTWLAVDYRSDLVDYDESGYGLHGETEPRMSVAIATPRRPADGSSYPNFANGVLRNANALADRYIPATLGPNAAGYSLTITCAHELAHGWTVCAWTGHTPGIAHYPFVGVMVLRTVVPPEKAEQVAELVLYAMTH